MSGIKGKIARFLRDGLMGSKISEITIEERRQIQLDMLSEFDVFCRRNGLRYSLGYGSLLGAVRHKGFIPWDDDVDLVMPLPDMLFVKEHLDSDKINFVDIDTDKNYEFSFPRLSYKNTCQKIGIVASKYGVNIDLYVMLGISEDKARRNVYFEKAIELQKKRMRARKWSTYLLYFLPVKSFPFLNKAIRRYREHLLFSPITVPYDKATCFYCASGYRDEREVYNFDVFSKLMDAPFENLTLMITAHYDQYLKKEYGDYMQLPPENERHPYHGGHYYWNK